MSEPRKNEPKIDADEVLSGIVEWVSIESPSHDARSVNKVVDHAELEATGLEWGRLINGKSPTAQRMLKYSFNLIDDGLVGQQLFAGETTRLAYMTDEAVEGRDSFLEKRDPDWKWR